MQNESFTELSNTELESTNGGNIFVNFASNWLANRLVWTTAKKSYNTVSSSNNPFIVKA